MTWFKIDDSFYDHPKILDLPDSAVALWVRAGCWAARNLTDGFVPSTMPVRLCGDPASAVRDLVSRGLWRRTRGGFSFHDWHHYQPTRAAVEERRTAARERMKNLRAGRKDAGEHGSGSLDVRANFARSSRPPTRPDPNSPKGSSGSGGVRPSDAPQPVDAHPYAPGADGACRDCGLPESNRRHPKESR